MHRLPPSRVMSCRGAEPDAVRLPSNREWADGVGEVDHGQKHPLTARVPSIECGSITGEGIVRSADNFGKLGDRPTHPEPLDWLATRFVEGGSSIKKLHKLILMSNAYAMSSANDDHAADVDPENKLLWRFNRRRLEAEPIRDALLAVAGNVDPRMGGTLLNNGNFTYVNNENSTNTARYDNHRRSVYLPVIRNTVFDFFQVFDFAEPRDQRQAGQHGRRSAVRCTLLNSPFVKEQAAAFADALLKSPGDDVSRVRLAYRKAAVRRWTRNRPGAAYVSRYETALATSEKDVSKPPAGLAVVLPGAVCGSEFVYVE